MFHTGVVPGKATVSDCKIPPGGLGSERGDPHRGRIMTAFKGQVFTLFLVLWCTKAGPKNLLVCHWVWRLRFVGILDWWIKKSRKNAQFRDVQNFRIPVFLLCWEPNHTYLQKETLYLSAKGGSNIHVCRIFLGLLQVSLGRSIIIHSTISKGRETQFNCAWLWIGRHSNLV